MRSAWHPERWGTAATEPRCAIHQYPKKIAQDGALRLDGHWGDRISQREIPIAASCSVAIR